jgi:hypothetical protein
MLTRASVAKRLGRSIATVRRMEGNELHPGLTRAAFISSTAARSSCLHNATPSVTQREVRIAPTMTARVVTKDGAQLCSNSSSRASAFVHYPNGSRFLKARIRNSGPRPSRA